MKKLTFLLLILATANAYCQVFDGNKHSLYYSEKHTIDSSLNVKQYTKNDFIWIHSGDTVKIDSVARYLMPTKVIIDEVTLLVYDNEKNKVYAIKGCLIVQPSMYSEYASVVGYMDEKLNPLSENFKVFNFWFSNNDYIMTEEKIIIKNLE